MKSTRQRLLETLEKERVATVVELSRALQVTEADVRHHLGNLRAEGWVVIVGEETQAGRGRPANRFGLAQRALEAPFDRLAGALLAETLEGKTPQEQTLLLERIAARLAGHPQPRGSLGHRLVQAVQRLNELHYSARWEAHASGPRLIFGRCPYASLLPEHPEICHLDQAMLEALLGEPVVQTEKLARDARGATYCIFVARQMPEEIETPEKE